MKKYLFSFALGLAVAALFSFQATYQVKKGTAEVEYVSGVYVFNQSTPVMEYEFLGKVNMPEIKMTGKPKEMTNTAIKRVLKQYPEADGIIFQSENMSKVDAIKFK